MEVILLENVINKYENELRNLAYRYVQDWILVDDIMQDVYLKVFVSLDTFKYKSNIKTWLFRITRNQCIDYLRSKVFKSTILIDNFEKLLVCNKETVEKEIFKQINNEELYQNIKFLPKNYQQTLRLYYFHNYSYKDISKLLCKDISFVKNNLLRGKRMLKNIYHNTDLKLVE
jgi:RNA polymerase sigma-70 factor, ECF subfamily